MRSAGTASSARRKVSEDDITWADLVFVMESRHARQLRQRFGQLMEGKRVVDLDVPDEYRFMDEELVEILDSGVRGSCRGLEEIRPECQQALVHKMITQS